MRIYAFAVCCILFFVLRFFVFCEELLPIPLVQANDGDQGADEQDDVQERGCIGGGADVVGEPQCAICKRVNAEYGGMCGEDAERVRDGGGRRQNIKQSFEIECRAGDVCQNKEYC